ncbi:hydroxymethylpyrimidine kinase /phosphomethylpyrimidine kinase [Cohaesibacter sp. ES.047]|uniref:bifunctional hydroxymethylpyrimidine kinase/phosphomethylpyrimidine kinase n=1 Tax=Cohaesibacter sp. ES.047 TaxID=1798205 RepID=UPI000BB76A31|nr:bifunctional hydroxymethylpyrimidine kinase/phosphomethylpyrimidine kinase [Cohaesibacter sp. ES.047]SNY90025.1 hydroxymethylpyrimidine kinase /phosphomethylpyrimidine kinase [Cohaesibacter sp. ES.047]
MIPNILSIAGSDPSGGAGIQADIKAISANGGYAMAVIAAMTAQSTKGVTGWVPTEPDFIKAQIAAILDDIRVDAIKIGMLGTSAIVEAVADALKDCDAPIVLDTVMVAKGGDRLLHEDAVNALRERLMPRARIITPNLPEAADLLGEIEATTPDEMERQARALLALGPKAVFLKGGHLSDDESPDLFLSEDQMEWLPSLRVATKNTHGTGCTLSSALATHLALTRVDLAAAKAAKIYISKAIAAADGLDVGHGHGPTDHFFAMRH